MRFYKKRLVYVERGKVHVKDFETKKIRSLKTKSTRAQFSPEGNLAIAGKDKVKWFIKKLEFVGEYNISGIREIAWVGENLAVTNEKGITEISGVMPKNKSGSMKNMTPQMNATQVLNSLLSAQIKAQARFLASGKDLVYVSEGTLYCGDKTFKVPKTVVGVAQSDDYLGVVSENTLEVINKTLGERKKIILSLNTLIHFQMLGENILLVDTNYIYLYKTSELELGWKNNYNKMSGAAAFAVQDANPFFFDLGPDGVRVSDIETIEVLSLRSGKPKRGKPLEKEKETTDENQPPNLKLRF